MVGIVVNMLFLNMLIRLPIISKIHDSLVSLRRIKFYQVLVNAEDDEYSSDENNPTSSRKYSDRNEENVLITEKVDETSGIGPVENLNANIRNNLKNKVRQNRISENLGFLHKTKNV